MTSLATRILSFGLLIFFCSFVEIANAGGKSNKNQENQKKEAAQTTAQQNNVKTQMNRSEATSRVNSDSAIKQRRDRLKESLSKKSDANQKVRGTGVRSINNPVDLREKFAGDHIVSRFKNGRGEDITRRMSDKRYAKNGTHDKLRDSYKHTDGTVTEVHADRHRKTKQLTDVKFKDPPDNMKSRSTLNKTTKN